MTRAAATGTTEAATNAEFARLAAPLRREITAHCYKMLGSAHDAEDLTQETFLRAWKAFGRFEGRSSVRTWMYQIATRVCLTALESRSRRPLPSGIGSSPTDPSAALETAEVPWLEPFPERIEQSDPATTALRRDGVRLAFVSALQRLTPAQRAVLMVRDVLGFSAAEAAETLGLSVAASNSLLQRARAHAADAGPADAATLSARDRELLLRYVAAFEAYDIPAIVATLSEDATWEMPPFTGYYVGAENIGALIGASCPADGPGAMRMLPTIANGQPAFGLYLRDDDGVHRPFHLQVLEIRNGAVAHTVAFFDITLFPLFGLPTTAGAGIHPAPPTLGRP